MYVIGGKRKPPCDFCTDPACDWSRDVVVQMKSGRCYVAHMEGGMWFGWDYDEPSSMQELYEIPVAWTDLPVPAMTGAKHG